MKAYLIARVSSQDQLDAIPAQVFRLEDYARRKKLDGELLQFQESAFKGNRTEFKKIVERIESETELVAVVFDKIDRLTRDFSDIEVQKIQLLCRQGKVEIHFVSDNLILHKNSVAIQHAQFGMGLVMAQYYSNSTSDNVKRRQDQKIRDGEWPGKAPFGYKNITLPSGKKEIIEDPFTGNAIQKIYEMYVNEKLSMKLIAKKVGAEYSLAIPTCRIDTILKNPFYSGTMSYNGKLYPHKYVPLVSQKLYELANKEYAPDHQKVYATLPYAYRGLIQCAECGCKISFERKKQKYVLGRCSQFKGKHGAKYVHEDDMTTQLAGMLTTFAPTQEDIVTIESIVKELLAEESQDNNDALPRLEAEISKYTNRLSKLYDDHADGMIDDEFYERKRIEYTDARQNLTNRKATFELPDDSWQGPLSNLLELTKEIPEVFENAEPEDKSSVLTKVLSNLELDDKQLRWELKKPYELMALCKVSGNWLPGRDSNSRPID